MILYSWLLIKSVLNSCSLYIPLKISGKFKFDHEILMNA